MEETLLLSSWKRVTATSLLILILISHIVASTSSSFTRPIYFEPATRLDNEIIFVSERIASNLIMNAVSENGGYKWLIEFNGIYFNPGFSSGAAGVGLFFLTLYNYTRNTTYLQYAEGAARWIISIAQSYSSNSVTWCSHDDEKCWFLTPDKDVSGIAKFLLRLYIVTKNTTYLNYAEKAAQWIIDSGLVRDAVGVYVLYNPPHQADFGIYSYVQRDVGTLMIELYNTTGSVKYLKIAKSIGEWLVYTSECDQYYCKWLDDRPYTNHYSVEGVSSVADLLYELYVVTKESRYLEVAERLVNWIESQGVKIDEHRLKFPNQFGESTTVIFDYWNKPFFPMTPVDIFIKSYLITKSNSRVDIVERYANWVISLSVVEDHQAKIPFSEERKIYHAWINARMFRFFTFLYNITNKFAYVDFAIRLLEYIKNTAKDNGFTWPRPDGRIWLTFGLGEGSCAIGYYLLTSLESITSLTYTMTTTMPSPPPQLPETSPQIPPTFFTPTTILDYSSATTPPVLSITTESPDQDHQILTINLLIALIVAIIFLIASIIIVTRH